ncbi:ATP-binding protein [Rothia halotolerans]|uniref:ATP-binding protein n=1 Tax=Rothia halotolerans TaxID=405770 RepID=UPI0013ECCEB9|nr:ATP-binding protein [Rothia halotolerans]
MFATTITMRSVLLNRVAEDANAGVTQEVEEFRLFAEQGVDPNTAQPFTSMGNLMEQHLEKQTPATGEAIISVAGPEVLFTDNAEEDAGETLAQDHGQLNAILDAPGPSGVTETEKGEIRWGKASITAQNLPEGEPAEGTLVVAQFTQAEVREVNRQVVLLIGVAAGGLLLTAGIAWLVAGRIMQPIRVMREVAESVNARDLSARIPVEGQDDVSQLAVTLNSMLERVERAYASQRHFIAEARGRLNGPRQEASRAIKVLSREWLTADERQRATLEAQRQLRRMKETLMSLEILAQADDPSFLSLRETSLKEVTGEVFAEAAGLSTDRRWVLEAAATGWGWLDPQRVREAMLQLARNAVTHSGSQDEIRIGSSLSDEKKWVSFWVADPGPELEQEEARTLFESYRSEGKGAEDSGMGLGLAMVKAVANAHGGTAWIESGEDLGNRFGLDIPLDRPRQGEAGNERPMEGPEGSTGQEI